jgi:poly-gamma-glutamate synthesis protein (capsule biosynthesis protein)
MGETLFGEQDSETEFHFMGTKFVLDDKFTFELVPYKGDLERNYKWIREARRQADIVIVGVHDPSTFQLAPSKDDLKDISKWVPVFAHGAIDAGADVFVCYGGPRLDAIEIYKGKVFMHGVSDFVRQSLQVGSIPPEQLARWNMSYDATAADWLELRARTEEEAHGGPVAGPVALQDNAYLAVCLALFDENKRIVEVRVVPLELSGGSRAQSGRPLMLDPASALSKETLEVVARRCAKVGTEMEITDGVGVVRTMI